MAALNSEMTNKRKDKSMKTLQTAVMVALVIAASWVQAQDPIYVDETFRLPFDGEMGVRADTGDVDGDGDVDIIVANGQHSALLPVPLQNVMLQINDGTGSFTNEAATRLPPGAIGQQLANAVILGDVDGDSDLDAYVANGSSGGVLCPSPGSQNLLWLNDGNGNFSDATALLPGYPDCSFDATFGDIDDDGDLDIVGANVGFGGLGEVNRVLVNDLDGSGVFIDATSTAFLSWPADITYTVALGDLDGDNDLDMVVGNAPASVPLNRFLQNNGGVFTEVAVSWTSYPPYNWPRPVWDVKLADMNGDGSTDILMTDALDGLRMILMINRGSWLFTSQTIYVSYQYGIDVADVDQDGDMDILVTQARPGGFPLRLLLNSGDSTPIFEDVSGGVAGYLAFGEDFFWDTIEAMIRFPKFVDVNDDDAVDIYLPTLVWWWTGWGVEDFQDRLLMNTLVPEPRELEVAIDIKFCSDPNAFNCRKKGVLPVTIFGAQDFDAASLDIASLRLCLEDLVTCTESGPVSWSTADRGNPVLDVGAAQCALIEGVEQDFRTQDGFLDLDVAFDAREVQALLGDFCTMPKTSVSPSLFLVGETAAGMPFTSRAVNDVAVDQLWKAN
jgi:hypothetical protein